MGAIQAQDYAMAKWAIGLRLNNSTDEMVEAQNKNIRHELEKRASLYGHFLNKEIELKYKD
jgi:hypothetical protein